MPRKVLSLRRFERLLLECIFASATLLGFAPLAQALPPIWESDFGERLVAVSDSDDGLENVDLSFAFPFAGSMHTTIAVNADGGIGLGTDVYVEHDLWKVLVFEPEFTDLGQASLAIFSTDLNPEFSGEIFFNDFGDRAVVTWILVASYEYSSTGVPFIATFQAQLRDDGTIVYAYGDFLGDPVAGLNHGIVVGLSEGAGAPPPGSLDLSEGPGAVDSTTIYEIWCYDEDPQGDPAESSCFEPGRPNNADFDLVNTNLVFTPSPAGFDVTSSGSPPTLPAIWESELGERLEAVSDYDDGSEDVDLSFAFPFAGSTYTTISVSANGGIGLGAGVYVDYDLWKAEIFEPAFSGLGQASLAIFTTDLNPEFSGEIFFNDFGDRAVVTWVLVASYEYSAGGGNPFAATFQAQLRDDGTSVYAYREFLGDPLAGLNHGVVVGLSEGAGAPPPGSLDLSKGPGAVDSTTIYEIWCYDEDPQGDPAESACFEPGRPNNSGFDLELASLVFTPSGDAGFVVTSVPEPASGLAGAAALATIVVLARRARRQAMGFGSQSPG